MTIYISSLFRLNSLEYRDLKEKLSGPIRNARNIVIKQSLSDQFLEAFHEQVNLNHDFRLPLNMVSISKNKNNSIMQHHACFLDICVNISLQNTSI